MNKKSKKLLVVLLIYILCFVFRSFEYFVLRTDQTFWGEAFIHKLIGIMIFYVGAKMYGMNLKDIGFKKNSVLHNLLKGLGFGLSMFIVAYMIEIFILVVQNKFAMVQIYVSAYAIDGNTGNQTSLIFFVICIIGNIINVVMEEGMFRGLFQKILEHKYSFVVSAIISSCLFGIWHIIAPIRSYCDGMIGVSGLLINIIMLIVTSGIIGFKFSLLVKMTGSLYMSMSDHFVNNIIVNIFHVISVTGADALQVVRIAAAQSLSFIIVLIYYMRNYKGKSEYDN
ncbi:MAG: CPBP family intramembrane metalloprotease [Lachnospiraceae bacterium]|nr:CPBP family intramembrane metalloprotease [Lachnospiraceae bacterium]